MGVKLMSLRELEKKLDKLREQYLAKNYDLLYNNCNHFSEDLVHQLLHVSIPKWINRCANKAQCVDCCFPNKIRYPFRQLDMKPIHSPVIRPQTQTQKQKQRDTDPNKIKLVHFKQHISKGKTYHVNLSRPNNFFPSERDDEPLKSDTDKHEDGLNGDYNRNLCCDASKRQTHVVIHWDNTSVQTDGGERDSCRDQSEIDVLLQQCVHSTHQFDEICVLSAPLASEDKTMDSKKQKKAEPNCLQDSLWMRHRYQVFDEK
ncbi:hypothetical protein RFI_20969 [Reticulomyxa filosa]|uniref:PPPDE domain-containing protein n=1 Tax=Reticulomyxa filosa TaxID=46433 RepID=X6MQY5_RETFI|nr:hypothetical protein RFI_20969 [Reticulomyxa filosa]|eukprot:ETO16378.1 hypothetical protein RFI_20969 [Reticulomyxa filosa]